MVIHLDTLLHELRIVWLVPPSELPRYVRECEAILPHRTKLSRRRQDEGPGVIVGYSELRPDTPSRGRWQGFSRRVFWLASHDPYPDGGSPCEAVDPRSVRAGERSESV